MASFGAAGPGSAEHKETPRRSAGQAWPINPPQPPRSGFVLDKRSEGQGSRGQPAQLTTGSTGPVAVRSPEEGVTVQAVPGVRAPTYTRLVEGSGAGTLTVTTNPLLKRCADDPFWCKKVDERDSDHDGLGDASDSCPRAPQNDARNGVLPNDLRKRLVSMSEGG